MDTPVEVCLKRIIDAGGNNEEIQLERLKRFEELLDELRVMFSMKHQNILTDFRVISYEEEM